MCCSISCRKSTCRYQIQLQDMSLRSSGSRLEISAGTHKLACRGPNLRSKAAVTSRQQVASTGQALCHQDMRLYHFAFGRFGSSSNSSSCIHSNLNDKMVLMCSTLAYWLGVPAYAQRSGAVLDGCMCCGTLIMLGFRMTLPDRHR